MRPRPPPGTGYGSAAGTSTAPATAAPATSVRQWAPRRDTAATPWYAAARAPASVSPTAVTDRTRPPADTTVPASPAWRVPACSTATPAGTAPTATSSPLAGVPG